MLSSAEAPQIEPSAAAHGRCLIADDSPMVRKIAGKMLAKLGYEIDGAENGRTALEKCCAQMPDLVLLDWNMPVMNGLDFLSALRVCEGGKAPIVIFCTTEGDVDHIRMGIETGADEYLMKPFDWDTLKMKVEMARRQRGLD